jgi:hypothetical protein
MERSGRGRQRKGKEAKRKLPDGEINVAAITPDVQPTRKYGGARVSVCSNRLLASILVSLLVDSNSHSHGLGASERSDEVFNLFLFQARFFVCSYSRQGLWRYNTYTLTAQSSLIKMGLHRYLSSISGTVIVWLMLLVL